MRLSWPCHKGVAEVLLDHPNGIVTFFDPRQPVEMKNDRNVLTLLIGIDLAWLICYSMSSYLVSSSTALFEGLSCMSYELRRAAFHNLYDHIDRQKSRLQVVIMKVQDLSLQRTNTCSPFGP